MALMQREAIEDLVIAVLAVNRWSLEKVFSIRDGLDKQGLFDFDSLAQVDPGAIAKKLEAAGYKRGDYMTLMMASRLKGIAEQMGPAKRGEMMAFLEQGDRRELETLLLGLTGVGPSVFEQFLCLREPSAS